MREESNASRTNFQSILEEKLPPLTSITEKENYFRVNLSKDIVLEIRNENNETTYWLNHRKLKIGKNDSIETIYTSIQKVMRENNSAGLIDLLLPTRAYAVSEEVVAQAAAFLMIFAFFGALALSPSIEAFMVGWIIFSTVGSIVVWIAEANASEINPVRPIEPPKLEPLNQKYESVQNLKCDPKTNLPTQAFISDSPDSPSRKIEFTYNPGKKRILSVDEIACFELNSDGKVQQIEHPMPRIKSNPICQDFSKKHIDAQLTFILKTVDTQCTLKSFKDQKEADRWVREQGAKLKKALEAESKKEQKQTQKKEASSAR